MMMVAAQAVVINPAFAFPLFSSYDKHGVELVVSGKRDGALAGNSRSAPSFSDSVAERLHMTDGPVGFRRLIASS